MKIKLIVLLQMSSLIWSTMGLSQVVPKVVLIQKNQPASFDGVLMPIEKLRELETDSLNAKLYKTELEKNEGSIPLYVAPDGSYLVLGGLSIAILFFFIGYGTR